MHGMSGLVAHRTISIVPLYAGGGQERGVRSGTEAVELAERFAGALSKTVRARKRFRTRAAKQRARLVERISAAVPDVRINEGRDQAPNILNLSLLGRDTDYLVALLDEAGFAVSTKSACETDSGEGSRAVFALTGDEARARATLRVSWGARVGSRALDRFAKALIKEIRFIDSAGAG